MAFGKSVSADRLPTGLPSVGMAVAGGGIWLVLTSGAALAAPISAPVNEIISAHDAAKYEDVDRLAAALLANPSASPSDRVITLLTLASAQEVRDQSEACLQSSAQALALAETNQDLRNWIALTTVDRASCQVNLGRFAEALADADKGLAAPILASDTTTRVSLLSNKGWSLEKLGRFAEADTAYTDAISFKPQDTWLLEARARIRSQLSRWSEALTDVEALLRIRADHPYGLQQRAFVLRELGRHEEALTALDTAFAKTSATAWIENERGRNLTILNRSEESEAAYSRALAADPKLLFAWTNRSFARIKRAAFEDALKDAEAALALEQSFIVGHDRKTEALLGLKRWQDALTAADTWLALAPENTTALFRKGRALDALGRLPDALIAYRRAVELRPDDHSSWNNIGSILERRGEITESLKALEEAVKLKPDSGLYLSNLAIAQSAQKQFDLALATLAKARGATDKPANFEAIEKRIVDAKVTAEEAAEKAAKAAEEAAKQSRREALFNEVQAMFDAGDFKGAEAKAKALERDPIFGDGDVLVLRQLRGEAVFKQNKRACEGHKLIVEAAPLNRVGSDTSIGVSGWDCAQLRRKAGELAAEVEATTFALEAAIRAVNRDTTVQGYLRRLNDVVTVHYAPVSNGRWKDKAAFDKAVASARTLETSEAMEGLRRALYADLSKAADTVKASKKPDAVNAMVQTLKGMVADLPADDRAYMKKLWSVIIDQLREYRGKEDGIKALKWSEIKRL